MANQQVRLLVSINYHSVSGVVHSPLLSGQTISEEQKCFMKLVNIFTKKKPWELMALHRT